MYCLIVYTLLIMVFLSFIYYDRTMMITYTLFCFLASKYEHTFVLCIVKFVRDINQSFSFFSIMIYMMISYILYPTYLACKYDYMHTSIFMYCFDYLLFIHCFSLSSFYYDILWWYIALYPTYLACKYEHIEVLCIV